jgi:diguanylate cyclase (GGDEF)-like protein
MNESFGLNANQPASFGPAIFFAGKNWTPRMTILTAATLAAVLICSVHAMVAGANTAWSAGIGYLCDSVTLLGCAFALWTRARWTEGWLRIRWCLITAAVLAEAVGFVPSFTEACLHTAPARQLGTACFNAGEALFLLAMVLFFAGVARSIVIVDVLQTLLFVVLRFNLVYSPVTWDHFTHIHLLVGQLVALVLFLVATVACLGAVSRGELKFLRTLAWFFGLRLVAFFTADQVSYMWLHHEQSSLWDVVGSVVFGGFALYLVWTSESAKEAAAETALARRPSVAVRSLMPSFLALLNLMLGLFMLRISIPLAAVAISVTLVSYVVRTALLHAQAAEEKAVLEIRNEQLEGLAVRDPLTGIGNRRSLAGVYSRLQAAAGDERLSLLLMDIDSFKRANDSHGHLFGDEVLVELARKLEKLAASVAGSHCARLGGDEFALLLPGVSVEEASKLAEGLRASFGAHLFRTNNFVVGDSRVSLSVGVASLEAARELPLETLVRCADDALYAAKLLGRDRVEVGRRAAVDDVGAAGIHFELQHSGG